MPRFAANVSMLFTEAPFLERFALARRAGFDAVEFLFPYEHDAQDIATALQANDLALALFNFPAGDFAAGDRGLASDPQRVEAFRESVASAMRYASVLHPEKMNCLAGKTIPGEDRATQLATLRENLRYAAGVAADHGVRLVMEPLNLWDAPGYLVSNPDNGFALIEEINHPNLKLEYDIYHAQRTRGNLAATIAERIGLIGHVQLADSPHRNEPGTGEINFPYVLQALDNAGYDGWVSLEYRPSNETVKSLGWLQDMGFWKSTTG
ncbi:MAG: TIM barrel protein [Thermomicrobiales bacterium]